MHCGLFGKMVMLYVAAGKVCGAADVVALFHALTVGPCIGKLMYMGFVVSLAMAEAAAEHQNLIMLNHYHILSNQYHSSSISMLSQLGYVVILADKRVRKSVAHGASRAATFIVAAWRDIKSSTGWL
jgi:hypothetical protein